MLKGLTVSKTTTQKSPQNQHNSSVCDESATEEGRRSSLTENLNSPTTSRSKNLASWPRLSESDYYLVIEATEEPDYFVFYSPDLEGFSGIGHSVEDCLFEAKWGIY